MCIVSVTLIITIIFCPYDVTTAKSELYYTNNDTICETTRKDRALIAPGVIILPVARTTRCTCDDCSLSHILTCGIMDSPIAEDLHIKLPLQAEPPCDYLTEVHPPSLSSGSSASGSNSSSPITIQQHPRLILPEGDAGTL